MPTVMKLTIVIAFLSSIPINVMSQEATNGETEDKFISVANINLHYLDFGGSGVPMILLQSLHDDATEWVNWRGHYGFAKGLTKNNRVLALTRRGWGKSTNSGWGYDTGTQADDVIGFMDAMGIEKAIMVGRSVSNSDMIWIAEHHPERLAGIVFIDYPRILPDTEDQEIRELMEETMSIACDVGNREKQIKVIMERASRRPHFMYNENAKIEIPTLMFGNSQFIDSPFPRIFKMLIKEVREGNDIGCDSDKNNIYFKALVADKEEEDRLYNKLLEADKNDELMEALMRAFDGYMKVVELGEIPRENRTSIQIEEINNFSKKIK